MEGERTYESYIDIGKTSTGQLRNMIFSSEKPSWSELQEIEVRRRAILRRVDMPFWRILFFWDGTCLKVMVRDGLLWMTVFLYVAVRVQKEIGTLPEYFAKLEETTNIDILGGFLSFFLVLFVNQANARFNTMYGHSMACTGRILDMTYLVAQYFPQTAAHRTVRYLHAVHAAGYVGLASKTYSYESFFLPFNENHRFLTDAELERVKLTVTNGGDGFREILAWVMTEIRQQQQKEDSVTVDSRLASEMRTIVQQLRGSMSALYHHQDQPIHFFYIHFLSLLTVFYLPIFAIATAYGVSKDDDVEDAVNWVSEVLSGLIVFLQAVFVIGLRLLGQVMVDPYGDDYEDLSVLHYIGSTWKASQRILRAQFPSSGLEDKDQEEMTERKLEDQRKIDLGIAWSHQKNINQNTGSWA